MKDTKTIVSFPLNDKNRTTVTHGFGIVNDFPVHFHTTFTIGIVEKGERRFLYRDEESVLEADDIFIIHPFEQHLCSAVDGAPHTYKIISVVWEQNGGVPYFDRLTYRSPEIAALLRKFHSLAEYDQSVSELEPLLDLILTALLTLAVPIESPGTTNRQNEIAAKARKFIDENCFNDISLSDIAGEVNLSEYHFNRVFHQATGMSPYGYLLYRKIRSSAEVLLSENNVTTASYSAGFYDQSHFIRLFKKHIGVTPGNYLRANRGE